MFSNSGGKQVLETKKASLEDHHFARFHHMQHKNRNCSWDTCIKLCKEEPIFRQHFLAVKSAATGLRGLGHRIRYQKGTFRAWTQIRKSLGEFKIFIDSRLNYTYGTKTHRTNHYRKKKPNGKKHQVSVFYYCCTTRTLISSIAN